MDREREVGGELASRQRGGHLAQECRVELVDAGAGHVDARGGLEEMTFGIYCGIHGEPHVALDDLEHPLAALSRPTGARSERPTHGASCQFEGHLGGVEVGRDPGVVQHRRHVQQFGVVLDGVPLREGARPHPGAQAVVDEIRRTPLARRLKCAGRGWSGWSDERFDVKHRRPSEHFSRANTIREGIAAD
ncbi:MAG: hypothetical protein NVV57_10885 [Demequina sp.]|nr:hypothetical protein [Demequina sp.]